MVKLNNFEDLINVNTGCIHIWTDGSAELKTKLGGVGVFIKYGNNEKKIKIGYKNTKTGRMEIKAVIIALNEIKDKTIPIVIYSDSQYVIKSITLWMENWIYRGWLGCKNVDLWNQFLQIYKEFDKTKIKFVHVKGHTDNMDYISLGNAIVDELASYKKQEFYHENDLII